MNDFTKDELQILHLDVNSAINKHNGILKPSASHIALRDKLECMINNYYEMKPPKMVNYICSKCHEEWHQCECKND